MNGLLVLSLDETQRICKTTKRLTFDWNDDQKIENLRKMITKVPSIRNTKIYYNSSGYYFFIDIFDEKYSFIMKMLEICNFNNRRYKFGSTSVRDYILFECLPDHEKFLENRPGMNEEEKFLRVFHWIIGVKGRILYRSFEEEYFSCGPYKVDFTKKLAKSSIKNLFPTKNEMRFYWEFFDRVIDDFRILLSKDYRWWFIEISKRVRMLC